MEETSQENMNAKYKEMKLNDQISSIKLKKKKYLVLICNKTPINPLLSKTSKMIEALKKVNLKMIRNIREINLKVIQLFAASVKLELAKALMPLPCSVKKYGK